LIVLLTGLVTNMSWCNSMENVFSVLITIFFTICTALSGKVISISTDIEEPWSYFCGALLTLLGLSIVFFVALQS